MTALLMGFLTSPTMLAIGGAIIAVIAAFFKGRAGGAAKERQKQAQERLKARQEADEIDDAIAGRTADENRKKLKGWGR